MSTKPRDNDEFSFDLGDMTIWFTESWTGIRLGGSRYVSMFAYTDYVSDLLDGRHGKWTYVPLRRRPAK